MRKNIIIPSIFQILTFILAILCLNFGLLSESGGSYGIIKIIFWVLLILIALCTVKTIKDFIKNKKLTSLMGICSGLLSVGFLAAMIYNFSRMDPSVTIDENMVFIKANIFDYLMGALIIFSGITALGVHKLEK